MAWPGESVKLVALPECNRREFETGAALFFPL
jgi:hypothetical protein